MYYYAIKIDGKYFKEFVHYQEKYKDRYAGHSPFVNRVDDEDIADIITTDMPERTEVTKSIGNIISLLVGIDKLKGKVIEIVPIEVKK